MYLISDFLLIIVESGNDFFLKQLIGKWMEDKRLYRYDLSGRGTNIINKMMNNLRDILLIRKLLKNNNYKIIFYEWGSTLLRRSTKLFNFKKPVIARIHRYELFEKRIKEKNFEKIDRIVLVSEYMRVQFLRRFPRLENKIIVIPNAVDIDKFYPDPNKKTSYNICILSNLIERKRIDLVIESMNYIKNPKVKLHIGGYHRILEKQLRKKVLQLNLKNRVFFDGKIGSVQEWFKDKDLIINSSNSEGFPVSVLEAMACQVIPLVRGWGGAKDLFPEEFVLPYDETNFIKIVAEKINKFYQLNPGIFQSKGKFVRNFILKHYSFENQVQSFENLFNSLITG